MTTRLRTATATLSIGLMVVLLYFAIHFMLHAQMPGLAQQLWLPLAYGPGLSFGIYYDALSAMMSVVVIAITLAVMVYSLGYMAGDPGYVRYYVLLVFFALAMLGLVLASNLLQLLVFWELVGLASFLLIGFWFERAEPGAAARKAFIMTRVGDVGFLLGVLLLIKSSGNVTIPDLVAQAGPHGSLSPRFVTIVAALLLMGAVGKSAQGPLLTWLPDAMAGPTPVSALLHSATMVAAGVYLVARLHGFFMAAPAVMTVLLWMSLVTAIAAATMAMVAEDIKRVLAYSSISQLAYMFMALAAGSVAAGFFHLVTHAGFKSLLFMAAGIFIHHAHSNEMREIARHARPRGRAASIGLITGAAALAGVIPFSGYFSKEAVLASLGAAGTAALALAYAGAFLTAYYAARMVFLTLLGSPTHHALPHDAPDPGGEGRRLHDGRPRPRPFGLDAGAGLARRLDLRPPRARRGAARRPRVRRRRGPGPVARGGRHRPGVVRVWQAGRVPGRLHRADAGAARFLRRQLVSRPAVRSHVVRLASGLSRAARWHDQRVLDGAGDSFAAGTARGGRILARIQGGQVQMYLAVVITLLVAFAIWLTRAELLL